MLVETLKWRDSKVLAIFTGKQYIFTNVDRLVYLDNTSLNLEIDNIKD